MTNVLAILSSRYKDKKIIMKLDGGEKNYLPHLSYWRLRDIR
ncbi:hypothetical protein [Bacillus sp. ISL-46]|nr:hypothetical protein [Bacillus sp. ISL-46]